jgi:hypothetical protein
MGANKPTPKKQLQKITESRWLILYISCEKRYFPASHAFPPGRENALNLPAQSRVRLS